MATTDPAVELRLIEAPVGGWRSWWGRPDAALAAAGVEGEWLVARVRLVVMGLLLITPTWKLFAYPDSPVYVWGFGVTFLAALAALAIWWVLKRGLWQPWLGFASSALDVTLVSTALLVFVFVGSPLVALNSTVTYEIYFLALLATSLRYDARICATVGLLALAQYGGLWAFSAARYDLDAVAAGNPGQFYNPVDQITRLILLAAAVLLSLAIVRRAQRLLYLAVRDRLTGLYNRGQFDLALVHETERAARNGQPMAVALIDLDHFKRINDTYGHAAGDQVLIAAARRLAGGVRAADVTARYGGEEFALLFPETDRERATAIVEALRLGLAAAPVRLANGRELALTCSAGVAVAPDDGLDPVALLGCADGRLLAAKRAGRNRAIVTGNYESERTLPNQAARGGTPV